MTEHDVRIDALLHRFTTTKTVAVIATGLSEAEARLVLRRLAAVGVELADGVTYTVSAPSPRAGLEGWVGRVGEDSFAYVQPGGGVVLFND